MASRTGPWGEGVLGRRTTTPATWRPAGSLCGRKAPCHKGWSCRQSTRPHRARPAARCRCRGLDHIFLGQHHVGGGQVGGEDGGRGHHGLGGDEQLCRLPGRVAAIQYLDLGVSPARSAGSSPARLAVAAVECIFIEHRRLRPTGRWRPGARQRCLSAPAGPWGVEVAR